MPESPEVQAVVEFLAERMLGGHIRSFDVRDRRVRKAVTAPDPVGARVNGVLRFGKYIDIDAGHSHVVCSLGRHGWVHWHDLLPPEPDGPEVVARLAMEDGAGFDLVDSGSFRSVGVWVVPAVSDVPGVAKLGPDPADASFTRGDFARAVRGRRKQIKAILQEQESLAGIGNAYSDEILHAARVAPTVHASALDDRTLDRLYAATTGVIRQAVTARRGVPLADMKAAKTAAMAVHGRGGEACPDCGGTIADIAFGGTEAQYCPSCQGGIPER
ncbi:DNA-formamidopyrimidine glycosylase family protein [Microbacterium caowuchunii]|uniref:Fpg/Nei family DNA glycosylase n=1 Tax=Microbacterium caowuchunii TaxID=2614638 RepID=A0A5N0TIA7_9MICO|nr:DNA-formamidopyrimidine glycosylase family protein [Microbacterium caowuchunii]KAA9134742.1 Fpg/Nei family DNA glycosylase [Microbacterium caowuchunii]